MLDDMYRQLAEKGLSQSSVKYAHRIMGVSLEHARRYHYISSNPARDILTKFGKQGKTPDPYTVDQMRQLLAVVMGTEGDGLAADTIAHCDYTVMIPMSHGVDSLNVAAASAVAFYQLGLMSRPDSD